MLTKIANAAKSAAAWGTNSASKKTVNGVHVHHHGGKPEGKEKPTFQKDELQLSKKQPAGGYAGKLEKNDGAENEKGADKAEGKTSVKDQLESKYGKLFQPMMGEKGGFQLEGKPGLKDGGKDAVKGKDLDAEIDEAGDDEDFDLDEKFGGDEKTESHGKEDKQLDANHKVEGKFDFNPDAADEAGDE